MIALSFQRLTSEPLRLQHVIAPIHSACQKYYENVILLP